MNTQNDAKLYHYGIKGMKWGRRKADQRSPSLRRKTSGSLTPKEQERIVKSGNPNTVKKHSHQLSDRNLKRAMERIDMTKSLGELKTKRSAADISRSIRKTARSVKDLASIYDTYTTLSNKMGRQTRGQKRRSREEAAKEAKDTKRAARQTARRYDQTLRTSDRIQDRQARQDLRRRGRVSVGSGDNMRTFSNYGDYRNYVRGERQIRRRRLREARR